MMNTNQEIKKIDNYDAQSSFNTSYINLDLPDYVSLKNSMQLQEKRKNDRLFKKRGKKSSIGSIYGEIYNVGDKKQDQLNSQFS